MSYMRGKIYVWVGGDDNKEDIFIWCANKLNDNRNTLMDNSGWADKMKKTTFPTGTWMPLKVFDELVIMRFYQLVEEGKVKSAGKRAIKRHKGNVGCDALSRAYGKPTVIETLKEEEEIKKSREKIKDRFKLNKVKFDIKK